MLALYHNDMSLCAQKVRICLAEKGLEWEDRHIALRSGEHQKEWYRKLNRRAVVPTLIDGDKVITEFKRHPRVSGRAFSAAAVEFDRSVRPRANAHLDQATR